MKIKNVKLTVFLNGSGSSACSHGREWAKKNCATLREVWKKCERADWMLWVLHRLGVYDQSISRFLVKVLREQPIHGGKTLFDLLKDERSQTCVEVLEQLRDGKATIEELKKARDAAADAAAAAAEASSNASYAASYAAAASASAAAAYAAASRESARRRCCRLIRARIARPTLPEVQS